MKKLSASIILVLALFLSSWSSFKPIAAPSTYLADLKNEMSLEWPANRTINLIFHGHSVPAGYFKTPQVNTLNAYPYQVLKLLKDNYPNAVINVINTSIGGENSMSGSKRFKKEVLNHRADVIFIDYALNDRKLGLVEARKAWEKMIKQAQKVGAKIILLTPTPDLKVDLSESGNELELHANQIKELAETYQIGLVDSYSIFKELNSSCDCLADYMSQSNHPNAAGHTLVASAIMKYFID